MVVSSGLSTGATGLIAAAASADEYAAPDFRTGADLAPNTNSA